MSAATATPTTEEVRDIRRPYTFPHIPTLKQLLPRQHGRPGLMYAQVHTANMRRAQDQGWDLIDGCAAYTIVGPSGSIDMVLMGKGKPIAGVGHSSGKRRCVVDIDVEQRTGLGIKSKPMMEVKAPNGAQRKG